MQRGKTKSKSKKAKSVKSSSRKSNTKSKSKKNATSSINRSSFTEALSCSTIGASQKCKTPPLKKKSKNSKSSVVDTMSVLMECKKIQEQIEDQTIEKCSSIKEMNRKGYKVDINKGKDNLFNGSGPGSRTMMVKIINLKLMTARYKQNFERHSVKIYKFIGKKPLCKSFPKIYEIFNIEKVYLIFMETLAMKTLYDIIVEKQAIPIRTIQQWIRQLTEGVCVLQQYGIAHRFIKLKHLVIDCGHIKILGWSKAVLFWDNHKQKALQQQKEKRIHKNNFLPPEAFQNVYDPSKADVWSLGTIIVSLLTHHYPFHVRTRMTFIDQWNMFTKKHPIDQVAKELCDKIFVMDPRKRIKVGDILRDRFFTTEIMIIEKNSSKSSNKSRKEKSKNASTAVHSGKNESSKKATSTSKSTETKSNKSKQKSTSSKTSKKEKSKAESNYSSKQKTKFTSKKMMSKPAIIATNDYKTALSSTSDKEVSESIEIQANEPTLRPSSNVSNGDMDGGEEVEADEIGGEEEEDDEGNITNEELQAAEEQETSAQPSEADEATGEEVNQTMVEAASALNEQIVKSNTNYNKDSESGSEQAVENGNPSARISNTIEQPISEDNSGESKEQSETTSQTTSSSAEQSSSSKQEEQSSEN